MNAPSPNDVARLELLGRGLSWHRTVGAVTDDDLRRARHLTARRANVVSASPLMPESALLVALHIAQTLAVRTSESAAVAIETRPAKRVLGVDAEPALLSRLAAAGHTVVALTLGGATSDVQASSFDPPLADVMAQTVGDPLPTTLIDAFDVVIVDTFRHDQALVPVLCRAAAALVVGGQLSVIGHALERDRLRASVALLPLSPRTRMDECVVRTVVGPRLADIFWDHHIFTRTEGALPIAPDRNLPVHLYDDLDPDHERHGCVEIRDVDVPSTEEEMKARIATLAAMRNDTDAKLSWASSGRRHTALLTLSTGATAAFNFDAEARIARIDVHQWSPALHVDIASCFVSTQNVFADAIVALNERSS